MLPHGTPKFAYGAEYVRQFGVVQYISLKSFTAGEKSGSGREAHFGAEPAVQTPPQPPPVGPPVIGSGVKEPAKTGICQKHQRKRESVIKLP